MGEHPTVTLTRYDDVKDAYRQKDLRQALYDEGEVVMGGVLVNLHGDEHRARRRVENTIFRRATFEYYERDLFPGVIDQTLAPYLAAGTVDLVPFGHQLMLNLAALTAGIDRPEGTAEETRRLYDYMMSFIEGATLAHSTLDKDERRQHVADAVVRWRKEFLAPSIERRQALLAALARGEATEEDLPRDVLTTLLRQADTLQLDDDTLTREIAFYLLAGAHTSATAFVRSTDHLLSWLEEHPEDSGRPASDRLFVQRCVHETVRLNPSSPVGMRWALAPVSLRTGIAIEQGSKVVFDLASANRDIDVFGPDAAEFNPHRALPPGVPPFGLSFALGMHVCIGQDLAAGTVPTAGEDPDQHLVGLVTIAVQRLFAAGVRRDPDRPPAMDTTTRRPYWGTYPVLFGGPGGAG